MKKIALLIVVLLTCGFTIDGYDGCTVREHTIPKYAGYYKNGVITLDIKEIAENKRYVNLLEHIYLHEYGHYIWEEKLTRKQKSIYIKGYVSSEGYCEGYYESWAEDYAEFQCGMLLIDFDKFKQGYDYNLMVDVLKYDYDPIIYRRSWGND